MTDDGARVLVDGRNDMYSEEILNEYNQVKNAEPGWEAIIDGYDVDALLFPPSGADHEGAGGGCGLVRGLPRRQRGRLPALV